MTISKLLSTKAIVKKGIPLGGTSALKSIGGWTFLKTVCRGVLCGWPMFRSGLLQADDVN